MELQHVKYFLALCEVKNFSQAAKLCGVTQPSLTAGIRRLENSIGGELFLRRPTGPTALALVIKPHLEGMIRMADVARHEANRFLLTSQQHASDAKTAVTLAAVSKETLSS